MSASLFWSVKLHIWPCVLYAACFNSWACSMFSAALLFKQPALFSWYCMCRPDSTYEAYVASNVQYQASTDPEYQALLSQRQQLQDPEAQAAMVCCFTHLLSPHALPALSFHLYHVLSQGGSPSIIPSCLLAANRTITCPVSGSPA